MITDKNWPFIPNRLSDLLDPDSLAVIQAGCCARIRRAMTIIEPGLISVTDSPTRIDPIAIRGTNLNTDLFCALFRQELNVTGGNQACEKCDISATVRRYDESDAKPYKEFTCHMGLRDANHFVYVYQKPVALLFAGQFSSVERDDCLLNVLGRIREIEDGKRVGICFNNPEIICSLREAARQLKTIPDDFETQLRREAHHISRIAENAYAHGKSAAEHEFLDRLRIMESDFKSQSEIKIFAAQVMMEVVEFCSSRYAILFATSHEQENVLSPFAHYGIPRSIVSSLPHFNWRKAELPLTDHQINSWNNIDNLIKARDGIRGNNSSFFQTSSIVLPATIKGGARTVLVLGPLSDDVILNREVGFLKELTRVVCWTIASPLQKLGLLQERENWKNATQLLTHQVKTAVTSLSTQIDFAYHLMQRTSTVETRHLIDSNLRSALNLSIQLGQAAQQTINSSILHLESEDLNLERYPLSVLIANCVYSFSEHAKNAGRMLILEDNFEILPTINVDIARMTIALSNLIDNAIKYSFPKTRIHVRPAPRLNYSLSELSSISIEIESLGYEIPEDKREQIFERGRRGLIAVRGIQISGGGIGLWESKSVIEAHKGRITITSDPRKKIHKGARGFLTIFSITLPIKINEE